MNEQFLKYSFDILVMIYSAPPVKKIIKMRISYVNQKKTIIKIRNSYVNQKKTIIKMRISYVNQKRKIIKIKIKRENVLNSGRLSRTK